MKVLYSKGFFVQYIDKYHRVFLGFIEFAGLDVIQGERKIGEEAYRLVR